MDFGTLIIVCPLVFLGALVDAVAGGGGLITLPAYLMAGMPAHMAIGTNKLSSAMAMFTSAARLYKNGYIDLRLALWPCAASFLGSIIGAGIALSVPEKIFELLLLALLPFAAILVMRKKTLDPKPVEMSDARRMAILSLCSLACGAYDGFYGPGAGTFMLILFSVCAHLDVRNSAGQMKMVNIASGLAALAAFAAAGEVNWMLGFAAGIFGISGSYIGAGLVVKEGVRIVRPIIGVVLCLLFAKTAWNYLF